MDPTIHRVDVGGLDRPSLVPSLDHSSLSIEPWLPSSGPAANQTRPSRPSHSRPPSHRRTSRRRRRRRASSRPPSRRSPTARRDRARPSSGDGPTADRPRGPCRAGSRPVIGRGLVPAVRPVAAIEASALEVGRRRAVEPERTVHAHQTGGWRRRRRDPASPCPPACHHCATGKAGTSRPVADCGDPRK